jgi:hypothetical protein
MLVWSCGGMQWRADARGWSIDGVRSWETPAINEGVRGSRERTSGEPTAVAERLQSGLHLNE